MVSHCVFTLYFPNIVPFLFLFPCVFLVKHRPKCCPFFIGLLFAFYQVLKVLCVFWKQIFYKICYLQMFSPSFWLTCSFSLCCSKSRCFLFLKVFIYSFWLCQFLVAALWILEDLCSACKLLFVAFGIQFPDQGMNLGPRALEACSLSH